MRCTESSSDTSFAFFYCRDSDEQRNQATSVARSLLAQLFSQNASLLPYLYECLMDSITPILGSWKKCKEYLSTVLEAIPQTLLVIDGIDECEQKERKMILNFFTSIVESLNTLTPKIRCVFISQRLDDIEKSLSTAESLELTSAHSERDVRNFAEKWSFKIKEKFNSLPEAARRSIVELVCDGEDGMFLFARLVLENLYGQENQDDVFKEIQPDTFPTGFDQAYVVHLR